MGGWSLGSWPTKTCVHGKKGLEEILSKVTSILKGIGSWKPESEGHGMPQT